MFGLGESTNSKYFGNILADFKPGEEPLTPAAVQIMNQRTAAGETNPALNCLPDGLPRADESNTTICSTL